MSGPNPYPAWAWSREELNQRDAFTLICIASYVHEDGCAWVSQGVLARKTRASVKSVQRALTALQEGGYLRRQPRARKDGSRTSDYLWLPPIIEGTVHLWKDRTSLPVATEHNPSDRPVDTPPVNLEGPPVNLTGGPVNLEGRTEKYDLPSADSPNGPSAQARGGGSEESATPLFDSPVPPKEEPKPKRTRKPSEWSMFLGDAHLIWNEFKHSSWVESGPAHEVGESTRQLSEFWKAFGKNPDRARGALVSAIVWAKTQETWWQDANSAITFRVMGRRGKLIDYAEAAASRPYQIEAHIAGHKGGDHLTREGGQQATGGPRMVAVSTAGGRTLIRDLSGLVVLLTRGIYNGWHVRLGERELNYYPGRFDIEENYDMVGRGSVPDPAHIYDSDTEDCLIIGEDIHADHEG